MRLNVFLIFAALCTVTSCRAQYDYFSQISSNLWSGSKVFVDTSFSYLQSGGSKVADTVTSYYGEYSKTKTASVIRDAYDDTYSYVRSGGSKVADTVTSYYDEYSKTKTASVIRDAYDDTYSYVRSGGSKIVDTVSFYYKGCIPQTSEPDVSEEQVKSGHSRTTDTESSDNKVYTPATSEPDVLKNHVKWVDSKIVNTESSKPTKDETKGEDNSHEKMVRECKKIMNDISDEALSRRIVNILLARTRMKSRGVAENLLFRGHFGLIATASQLEALHNFGRGKLTHRQVAPILDDVIKAAESDSTYEFAYFIRSTMTILFDLAVKYRNIIIIIVSLSYVYWLFNNARRNIKSILLTGIQIIFIATFLLSWWELPSQLKNKDLWPVECQHTTTQRIDKTKTQPSSPECQKHYDAMMDKFGNLLHIVLMHTFERVGWIVQVALRGIMGIITSLMEYVITRVLDRFLLHLIFLLILYWIYHNTFRPRHPQAQQRPVIVVRNPQRR